jgi:hypothetical protein
MQALQGFESAGKRTRMAVTTLSKLQRHTGAGSFVRSRAEEDNFLIFGQFADAVFNLIGRDPN